jgi:hypothetical protein
MNKLLSEEYRRVLEIEHANTPWGVTGWHHAPYIYGLLTKLDLRTMLDYGAGRGSLGHWFDKNDTAQIQRREYEPGIPKLGAEPQPAQLVACIDVMEHVEPDCVDSVLDHIQGLSTACVYFNISCRPAGRILSNGHNAHLSIQEPEWWRSKLCDRWQEQNFMLDQERQAFNWVGLVRP